MIQKNRRRNAESHGNTNDVQQRDVSLAALNLSHVSTIYPGSICQRLLRQAKNFALFTDSAPQLGEVPFLVAVPCYPFHGIAVCPWSIYHHGIYDPIAIA